MKVRKVIQRNKYVCIICGRRTTTYDIEVVNDKETKRYPFVTMDMCEKCIKKYSDALQKFCAENFKESARKEVQLVSENI